MKVFLGLTNIASMYLDLKESFKQKGVDTLIIENSFKENIIQNYSDFNIQKAKGIIPYFKPRRISVRLKSYWNKKVDAYIFKRAIKECDVFIFFWGTFLTDHSDLQKLKSANKTIINVFVGDDVRWFFSMKQEFESYHIAPIEYGKEYDYTVVALDRRLKYLRNVEKYSDFIFSRLDQAQLQLRPYYRWNMMVPVKNFNENTFQRKEKPIVAHAPSHRGIKGTAYVLEVFDQLKRDGVNFEILLIENVPNKLAIELYGNSDILIDQLLCPGSGKLATEALACGTIVMGHMAYDKYPQNNPIDCPIIDVNPETLYAKLKDLILDFDFRNEHSKKGRPYVEKYLHVDRFTQTVLDLTSGKEVPYDYKPNFFREKFIPESSEALSLYNSWMDIIKECSWYKEGVKQGERDGLVF